MKSQVPLSVRLMREDKHGEVILQTKESNWGWNTNAGRIRKERRSDFLTACSPDQATGFKVLEVGCGTGTFTDAIARVFRNLTCIDISEALLKIAVKKYPQVHFKKEDIHHTTFADATFDLVLGCSVLHHLEWDLALAEIGRILKPAGELRFSEPNLLNPQIFLQKKWPWLKRRLGDSPDESAFTPAQIRRTLTKLGFTKISVTPFEFLHPSTPAPIIPAVIKVERFLSATPLVNFAGSMKVVASRAAA